MTDKAMNEVHTKQSETEPSRNPEYLRLTTTELEKILEDHKQWLETKEREGKPIELQGADLQGADLSNRDLRKTRLEGVIFGDASMSGASLREANLHGTDLSRVRGLLAGQLAGANLSATKLPKDIRTFEGPLQFIDEGSKNARKLFFGMLAGCAYTVLTLANTTDARLLTNSASLRLPIIGTEIPIVGFFITTPLLLLGIYLYFQIYMQRLWESLSKLPAIFPDGRSLDEKAYPWLLVGYISAHVRWLKYNRPSLSHLQTTISIFLSWWVVPSTLVLLWARYLVRHDWFGTSLHIIVVGISCGAGIYFQRSARRTLRGKVAVRKHRRKYKTLSIGTLYAAIFLLFGAIFYLMSREGIEDTPSQYIDMSPVKAEGKALQWDSYAKIFFRDFFRANLVETDVSTRPSGWTEKNVDLSLVKGASLRGVDLRHANAFRAFLINADLRDTDLRGAMLAEADLRNAKMLNANVEGANLQFSDLRGIVGLRFEKLKKARCWPLALYDKEFLKKLKLPENHNDRVLNKDLESYDLSKTNLEGAELSKANLSNAFLKETNFERASLTDANLSAAKLQMAKLRGADLEGAYLVQTDLSCADLKGANFRKANLSEAKFQISDFGWSFLNSGKSEGKNHCEAANLEGADLKGANLQGARLEFTTGLVKEQITQAKYWVLALYDKKIIDALGLPSDHNKKAANLDLSGYTLRGADLSEHNLTSVNLRMANLEGANLKSARLMGAELERAVLKGANLREAQLEEADLKQANLKNADLKGAKLPEAELGGAILEGADLEGALLGGVNLTDASLEGANLKGANLRAADLSGANLNNANLWAAKLDSFSSWTHEPAPAATVTVEQLCEAKTLYAADLEEDLSEGVKERCPHLLEETEK